ncbi:MAG TPA: 2-dehydropantoate 2-reductase [Armatimonadota bacterium]|jgi:2-dehydropantoate 2-reductase
MTHPLATTGIRLAIIGPGALGTLFAARLALAGAPLLLLDYRQERAHALQRDGIRLRDAAGEQHVHLTVTADPQALGEVDAALVLVKAYRTEEIAETLAAHLPAHAVALTLQNGLGNVETLQLHLGQDRVFGGTTAQGAFLESPGVVRDMGAGPITVGSPCGQADARLDDLCQALLLAGFAVSITCDLPAALWQKAILNAAINPVGALTRLRNGQLAAHLPSRKLMVAAAREAHAVARALGVAVEAQDWAARLQAICQATAPNINSMLQDVLRGRRTEIDAINGAIVRAAEHLQQPAPINHTLCCLVQAVEQGYAEAATLT